METWGQWLLLVPLLLSLWGLYGIAMAWKYRSPVEMTYSQYLQRKPVYGWLRLKDVRVDLRRAVGIQDRGGQVTEVLVPVEPVSNVKGTSWPVYVVLATREADTTFIVDQMKLREKTKDPGVVAAYVAENRQAIVRTRDIEGLASADPPPSAKADRKTFRQVGGLEEDYVVVVEGPRPGFFVPTGILVVGLLAGACLYMLVFVPPVPVPVEAPVPVADEPARRRSPHQTMDFSDGPGARRGASARSAARPEPPDDDEDAAPEPASAAEAELMEILRSPAPTKKAPSGTPPPRKGPRRDGGPPEPPEPLPA